MGLEVAVTFLINFGGSALSFSGKATPGNQIVRLIGIEATQALYDRFEGVSIYRIPVAKKFLARYFRSCNLSNSEIARILRVTDTSVRSYLMSDEQLRERTGKIKDDLQRFARSKG
ncbi:hypothetical protein C5748_16365 [Phyllobacterium phragmitis]|uniref:Uncharacterized protein n=1 Tax=Phyllobacterium phragmitis TaxID=2670329 RepID=A0A2S9IPC9_9HYPH|nr:hypothetical protein C5748_16365 [Phyllobacterium phragmitis]